MERFLAVFTHPYVGTFIDEKDGTSVDRVEIPEGGSLTVTSVFDKGEGVSILRNGSMKLEVPHYFFTLHPLPSVEL